MTSVDVVLPVYNEERDLPPSVATLHQFLSQRMAHWDWRIVVADNGSTDATLATAQQLGRELSQVGWIHLDQKGRGRALRRAWLESAADVVSYMDVDLATDLEAFPPLVSAIAEEGYDVAIGSRLARGARVSNRPWKRELTSRGYIAMIKALFWRAPFTDAQCGFKALSRAAATALVPLVQDNAWFFDTELLILGYRNGFRIRELPVQWRDDPDSRVRILATAREDMKGLMRLRLGGVPRVKAAPRGNVARP